LGGIAASQRKMTDGKAGTKGPDHCAVQEALLFLVLDIGWYLAGTKDFFGRMGHSGAE
jgi:hypothetical protein